MNETISIIIAVLGGIAGLGGTSAYFRKGQGDSIIAYQTKENELLKDTNARLEKELAAKSKAFEELEKHNRYLQKLGQGSPQLKKLTEIIAELVIEMRKNVKR